MIRTQISLTEEQMARARSLARRRGVSLASVVRDALDRELALDGRQRSDHTALRGRFRSGEDDVAERHDDHLGADRRGW